MNYFLRMKLDITLLNDDQSQSDTGDKLSCHMRALRSYGISELGTRPKIEGDNAKVLVSVNHDRLFRTTKTTTCDAGIKQAFWKGLENPRLKGIELIEIDPILL